MPSQRQNQEITPAKATHITSINLDILSKCASHYWSKEKRKMKTSPALTYAVFYLFVLEPGVWKHPPHRPTFVWALLGLYNNKYKKLLPR